MATTFKKIYENYWIKAILISSDYNENYSEKDYNNFNSISFPVCNGFLLETSNYKGFIDSNTILFEKENFDFSISKYKEFKTDISLSFQFKDDIVSFNKEILKNKTVASYYRHPKYQQLIHFFLTDNCKFNQLLSDELLEEYLLEFSSMKEKDSTQIKFVNLKRIERAKEFINNSFNENIRLIDIAKTCHISPFHFARIFKNQTGYSPNDFLLKRRIEKAKELLKKGNLISQVAFDSGFNSLEHFSYSFKKAVKQSPTEYRNSKISKTVHLT